jgi:LmbE family N-acetylglucosaminyl deacetylase
LLYFKARLHYMKTLVIAPHADDELLGCGGTLLRRTKDGGIVGWLLMTAITETDGWDSVRVANRALEIERVRQGLGIPPSQFFALGFPTTKLDQLPLTNLIEKISIVIKNFKPEEILLPHPGDVHSDHGITFKAATACTKWFRYPSIRRILTYETLSETDFGIDPRHRCFNPNVFVDITCTLEEKVQLLGVYQSEMGEIPFPRSEQGIRALATIRGVQSGFMAAEGFCLLRERN